MRPGGGRGRFEKKAPKAKNIKVTVKRLVSYMKGSSITMVFVTLLVLLSSMLSVTGPYILGRAVDEFLYANQYQGYWQLMVILLLVYVAHAGFSWITSYLVIGVSQKTVMRIRKALFGKLQKLPVKFFDQHSDGDLVSRLTNDIDNISNTLNQSLTQIISSSATLLAVVIMMLALDLRLTLISMVSIPFVMVFTQVLSTFSRKLHKDKLVKLGALNSTVEETISGQKVIIAYGQESNASKDFEVKNEAYRLAAIKAESLTSIMGPTMNFVNNVVYGLIALAGGVMVVNQMTTVGVVVIFINYSRQFARPINQIATLYNSIQGAIAGAERVFEIMDQEEEPVVGKDHDIEGKVVLDNVCFSYESDKPILKGVSMKANEGDMVAIVGPTGAGKTTVINLLTRFYDIDSGKLLVDGLSISESRLDHLRSQLGIVLQDTYLFTGTVLDNIRYGNPSASMDEVVQASKLSNAHQFIHRLPDGYDTVLSGEGFGISQGQRQLIAIARAILANPKILILDEATSSVDTRTEKLLQEGLMNLMKGRTSFVIAHRLSTIKAADRIYVVDQGRIIEEGNHQELMSQGGHYHEMYTTQYKIAL